MSNKNKAATKREGAKPALVPKLRFPEFQNAGDWTTEVLRAVATIRTEKVGNNVCVPMSITSGVGLVSQEDKFGRVIAGDSYKNYLLLKPNEFAYNKSATKEYPEGFLTLYSGTELAAVPNSIFTCFRINGDSPDVRFLNCQFSDNLHGRWLRKFIQVGARAHGSLSINDNDLMALPVPVPTGTTSVAEQQKIAECLSSVDELIAAQAAKVDAFKTHKKGLMQQLFPSEGKTFPSLRLPEFQGEEGWKILPLAALADKIMVGIASAATHAYRETGVPMLRNQNIKEGGIDDSSLLFIDPIYEAAHKNKRLKTGDVITVRTGYPGLSAVVTKSYENAQCFTSLITRPKADILDSNYLCLYINSPIGKKFMLGAEAGGAQKNVNAGTLETLKVHFPQLEEQRKIASSLNNLDALISAETQKLEALAIHKKGLTQQLFPSAEGIDA
ncbi:restriction endonuclease subunit S [Trinickia dinghuensis]|uniref:Restriction endonuclease subunit S n=1 Tax=Trinickia dinghuensis TaxID=2291023 RepID=A0A3D8JZV1_9BURK|nr:restriction endonuclease subunit S [Trinickia dinghuensis]RDU98164.1 restriction endonuclease subunit S [Trinickia dinghuensis]